VQLLPADYHAVRRNPADFNQALRDHIESQLGDSWSDRAGAISAAGVGPMT